MATLKLPCATCAPSTAVVVAGSVLTCASCGSSRSFVRAPLDLITGAPGTGKSTLVPHLAGGMPGTAVFDTDLFGPWSNPDWTAWANSWLLVAYGLAQSGVRTVLCGYGISKSKAELLPCRVLLDSIRAVNLDIEDGALRERLRRRPGYDEARIERKISAARELRDEADANVDVTGRDGDEIAERVLELLA